MGPRSPGVASATTHLATEGKGTTAHARRQGVAPTRLPSDMAKELKAAFQVGAGKRLFIAVSTAGREEHVDGRTAAQPITPPRARVATRCTAWAPDGFALAPSAAVRSPQHACQTRLSTCLRTSDIHEQTCIPPERQLGS